MTEPTGRGTPVATETPDLVAERVRQLQALFPDVVTEGRVDFDKLRAALGDSVNGEPERYSFTWAGKRDAISLLQMPSRATLLPAPDESVNWDETKHLFIEGDNLEVLKLLYKAYFGRVKMIYIDPPYNTGNDFIYPDNFADSLDTYLRITGQRDENGNGLTSNPETSGRYHSAWLSMMYPRLFVARQLLRDDGVIFVSIDDHEVHNLRMLMNEVFGEENFLSLVTSVNNLKGRSDDKFFATANDYILCFSKNSETCEIKGLPLPDDKLGEYNRNDSFGSFKEIPFKKTGKGWRRVDRPDMFYAIYYDPATRVVSLDPGQGRICIHPMRGNEEGRWRWGRDTFLERKERDIVVRRVRGGNWTVFTKMRLSEGGEERTLKPKTIWIDQKYDSAKGADMLNGLLGSRDLIDNPKPVGTLEDIVRIGANDSDIVLDFFAGSSTTAQAVLELNREDGGNRRFIMVQLPEPTPEDSTARQQGFETIADIGKERIRRVATKLHDERNGRLDLDGDAASEDLGFRVFKLNESHYRRWTGLETRDAEHYAEQMELFIDPLLDGWQPEGVIWEVAIKEGYGLTARIEPVPDITTNAVTRVSDPDTGQSFLICLDDTLDPATVAALRLGVDDLFICRDVAADDTLMANLALNCRFKTI